MACTTDSYHGEPGDELAAYEAARLGRGSKLAPDLAVSRVLRDRDRHICGPCNII